MQQLSFMFLRLIIQNFVLGCPGGGGRGRITFRRKHFKIFFPVIVIVKNKKTKNNNNQTTYRSRLIILNYVLGSPGEKNERLQS